MVIEGGEVRLVGTLDTSNIERGQRRVSTGFEEMKSKSGNTAASLAGLKNVGQNLAGAFSAVSTAGIGALSGLAMTAPQTAGALASIEASTKQLSLVAGEELAPAFEVAAQKYGQFVDFMASGSPMSEIIKDVSFLAGAGGIATVAGKLSGLKNIGKIAIPVTIAVTSISIADDVSKWLGNQSQDTSRNLGLTEEGSVPDDAVGRIGNYLGYAGTGAVAGGAMGSFIPLVGTAAGAGLGAIAGLAFGISKDARETFFETDTTGANSGG